MSLRKPSVRHGLAAFVVAAMLGVMHPASAADLEGAGSTFVTPVMTKWAEAYKAKTGLNLDYQSVGSGAGIDKVEAEEVDFGATDKPLQPEELAKHGLSQFPIVVGGVTPVVNVPGVRAGQLRFSGELLADIFLGKVTQWDSPEVKALNPNLALPHLPISVVYRSDSSGTTYNWTDFLAKASPAWRDNVGAGLTVPWPRGQGGAGNAGVAALVKRTPGAVGYVEYAYAIQEGLAFGQVENTYGLFVAPNIDSFEDAAATVRWQDHKDFDALLTDAGGPTAYPITATTFILMPRSPRDPARAAKALQFFKWALEEGDPQASELNYAALPPQLVVLVERYWKSSALPGVAPAQARTPQ
jgi:phosphate transport system substrate-binding protein